MSERMKKYKSELQLLTKNCSPHTKQILFKYGNNDFIRAIVDAVWTTLEGKVPLSRKQLENIRKSQLVLRKIASKNSNIKKRRRLLCTQQGGNAIVDLMSTIQTHL